MFDLSFAEIIVVVVIAVMVMGPKELPVLLRALGRWLRKLRHFTNEFREYFSQLDESGEMRALQEELREQARYVKGDEGELYRSYDLSDISDSSRKPKPTGSEPTDG